MILYGTDGTPLLGFCVETEGGGLLLDRNKTDCSDEEGSPHFQFISTMRRTELSFSVTNFTGEFMKVDIYLQPAPGDLMTLVDATNPGPKFCLNQVNEIGKRTTVVITSDQSQENRKIYLEDCDVRLLKVEKDIDENVAAGRKDSKVEGVFFFIDVVPLKGGQHELACAGAKWRVVSSLVVKENTPLSLDTEGYDEPDRRVCRSYRVPSGQIECDGPYEIEDVFLGPVCDSKEGVDSPSCYVPGRDVADCMRPVYVPRSTHTLPVPKLTSPIPLKLIPMVNQRDQRSRNIFPLISPAAQARPHFVFTLLRFIFSRLYFCRKGGQAFNLVSIVCVPQGNEPFSYL